MEGMQLDVFEHLQALAERAVGATDKIKVVEASQLGPGKCLIVKADGSFEIKDKVDVRHHILGNVQAVIDWVLYARKSLEKSPVVWVNSKTIRVVLDDADATLPRPVVVCELKETEEYQLIKTLAKADQQFDQKGFIRLLRSKLWDCLDYGTRDDLVKSLRSLRFNEASGGRSNVSGSRESMGIDFEMQVKAEVGELPDLLKLSVRLFQDNALAVRQPVEADLEVNINTKPTFCLSPISSDLDEALENETEALFGYLKAKLPDSSVFRGVYQGKSETSLS